MGYFGIFEGYKLEEMNLGERNKLFLSKGIYEEKIVITLKDGLNLVYPTKDPPLPKPTKPLLEAFHGFLLRRYRKEIEGPYYSFFVEFNDEIYGLNEDMARSVALKYFKTFSKEITTKTIRIFRTTVEEEGVERVINYPKMEMLLGQREAMKSNLVNSPLLLPYLSGDNPGLNQVLAKHPELLEGFIDFEITLKILDALNKLFGFETKPGNKPQNRKISDKPETKPTNPENNVHFKRKTSKKTKLSDKEAVDYLISNFFRKMKTDINTPLNIN